MQDLMIFDNTTNEMEILEVLTPKFISANSYFGAGAAAVNFVNVDSRSDVHVLPPSVDDSYLSVYCVLETSFSVKRVFIGLPCIIVSVIQVQVSPLTFPLAVISSPQLSNAL
jgi:malate/lactate dehydrogenase